MHLAAAVKRIHKDCVARFWVAITKPSIFSLLPTQFRGKKTSTNMRRNAFKPKEIQTNKNVLSLNLQSQTTRKSHNQSEEKTQTRSFNTDVHLRNICNEKLREN
jgi:hypothetical protein